MAAQPQLRLTPEQYLEIERAAEFRSEFYNGRTYAMAGASPTHVLLVGNLTGELRSLLRNGPGLIYPNDLRVRVSPSGLYTYPDVVVVCGESVYADKRKDTLINPALIIEVLSPTTEAYDRGFKFTQYRTLESLKEYALAGCGKKQVLL